MSIQILCILDNSPLSGMSFTNMYFQSMVCLFILLALSFTEQKLLMSSLLVISSTNYTLDVVSEKSSPHWRSSTFSPVILEFSSFVFSFWVNFSDGCRVCVYFLFLVCECLVVPVPCVEKIIIFFTVSPFARLSNISWLSLYGSISGLYIVCIDLFFYSAAVFTLSWLL